MMRDVIRLALVRLTHNPDVVDYWDNNYAWILTIIFIVLLSFVLWFFLWDSFLLFLSRSAIIIRKHLKQRVTPKTLLSALSDIMRPVNEIGWGGQFIVNNNGTVFDTDTNLMWALKDNGSIICWQDAKVYCENYSAGGYKDWRLPTQNELSDLYDKLVKGNSGYLSSLITFTGCLFWTSECRSSDTGYVDFSDGFKKNCDFSHRVLPVRSAI